MMRIRADPDPDPDPDPKHWFFLQETGTHQERDLKAPPVWGTQTDNLSIGRNL